MCGLSSEELIGFVENAQLIEADEFLNDPGIWLEIGIHDGGHAAAVEVLPNLMRRVWRIPDGDLRGATVHELMIGYGVFGGLNRANRGGSGTPGANTGTCELSTGKVLRNAFRSSRFHALNRSAPPGLRINP